MTEILPDSLWLCSIGELRLEIHRSKAQAIISLTEPDDFRSWESTHKELVEFYHSYSFPDGPLPDLAELERLTKIGVELISSEKRLIVHCAAGHNRSGLLTALILRQVQNISGRAAMEYLHERRSLVLWNKRYVEYLSDLDRPFGLQPPTGTWE